LIGSICLGQDLSFEKMIDNTLDKTVPFIKAKELREDNQNYTILDIRELKEYNVSHIKNAISISFNDFNVKIIKHKIDKNTPIVVYCSIGYRSEKVGEKLLNEGFTVYNLYGGIFNWMNSNNPIVDNNEITTQKVHCFNQKWSKWLLKGEKIYD
jgi:rhodanese-related sulfurtransferase